MSQSQEPAGPVNPYASPVFPALETGQLTPEDTDRRQLAAFVGRNAQYYVERWTRLLRGWTRSAGFNWAAFLFSGMWLPYRKMYTATFIFYAIIIFESVAEEVVFVRVMGKSETPRAFEQIVGLVAAIVCGAYGNRWYLSHARSKIAELSREGFRDDALLRMLAKRGGTNVVAALGLFVSFLASLLATLTVLEFLLYGN